MEFRHAWLTTALLILVCGCSQPAEEYRTFSEGTDGEASQETGDVASGESAVTSPPALPPNRDAAVNAATSAPPATAAAPNSKALSPSPDATALSPAPKSTEPSPARPPRVPLPERIAMLAAAPSAAGAGVPAAESGPLEIRLLVPEREFSRVDSGKSLRVSYDDLDLLKVLNMEPVPADCEKHFPDWLKALDGVQVRIRGFMIPPPRETDLPGFTLARDNQICCFGRDPKVYDVIPVFLKEGTTTDYIPNRPFDVVGKFFIRPDVYRGELQNLYEIEDAEVITN
jgi:hypothetical protein